MNFSFLKIKSLKRHGDTIPDIDEVVDTPSNAIEVETPIECDICGEILINEGSRLFCPNRSCPKVEFHRLLKWFKKLDIFNLNSNYGVFPARTCLLQLRYI